MSKSGKSNLCDASSVNDKCVKEMNMQQTEGTFWQSNIERLDWGVMLVQTTVMWYHHKSKQNFDTS